jgi:hypothetical protein
MAGGSEESWSEPNATIAEKMSSRPLSVASGRCGFWHRNPLYEIV